MDVLDRINTGAGLSSAAGSGSGGISDRPRPGGLAPSAGDPRRPPIGGGSGTQAKGPSSGGVGGINKSMGGNAPVTQAPGKQSPAQQNTTTKKKGPDENIDYGGCPGCDERNRQAAEKLKRDLQVR
jgi:hypothetical protein